VPLVGLIALRLAEVGLRPLYAVDLILVGVFVLLARYSWQRDL
jgi:hypothetical protein